MKIAAAQIASIPGDLERNLRKVRDFASRAKESGAELIVFPEMIDTGYSMPAIQKHATSWKEGAVPRLQEMAKQLSLAIVAGVSDRDGSHIYNSAGVHRCRRQHPREIPQDAFGDRRAIGRAPGFHPRRPICELQLRQLPSRPHDLLRSSVPGSLPRPHIEHGANVFINSSAWPFPRLEHLRILALTRAIENQSYLILANRVGSDDGVTFCGTSVIIDPYGVIVAAASADREELIQAEISQDVIDAVRKRMAVFEHRRTDLY